MSNGKSIAWIITLSNRIKPYTIRSIHERMFLIPDLGLFELDEEFRYRYNKSEVYVYHQKSCRPVDIESMLEVSQKLGTKRNFSIADLENYVLKFKMVEEKNRILYDIVSDLEKEKRVSKLEIMMMLADGSLEEQADKILHSRMSKNLISFASENGKFSQQTIKWINSYYSEDVVGRNYMYQRLLAEERFRLKPSLPIVGFMPQPSMLKRNIAIVVNGRQLELDTKVKVEYDHAQNCNVVSTSEHGKFAIQDNETIYRNGKTRMYFVGVKTKHVKPVEQKPLEVKAN